MKVVIVDIKVNGKSVDSFEASDYQTYDEFMDAIKYAVAQTNPGLKDY